MKHKLLLSEKDRWEYFWSFFRFKIGKFDLWKPEDRPLLEPFFKFSEDSDFNIGEASRNMTDEEIKSFEYWKKCRKEYSDELSNMRNELEYVNHDSLLYVFGYEDDSALEQNDDNWEYSFDKPLKSILNLTYPVICVNWLESGMDGRGNKGSVCCVDYVELKEFDVKN